MSGRVSLLSRVRETTWPRLAPLASARARVQRFVVFARLMRARWAETESEAYIPRRARVWPPLKASSAAFTGAAAARALAAASGVRENGRPATSASAAQPEPAAQRASSRAQRGVLDMQSP